MRNTEDKVYACTYADTIESKKEGDCGENEEGKGRKREAKRERERSPTVILRGTKRREEARAPVMYADCKSAIMSLSRVYGNPQHRRGVPAPSLRSISVPPAPLSPPLSYLPPRHVASSYAKKCGRPGVYTERGDSLFTESVPRAMAWHGTIISVDYAIITRPGGGGSGHLMPLTRLRKGLLEPTSKGYAGSLPPRGA